MPLYDDLARYVVAAGFTPEDWIRFRLLKAQGRLERLVRTAQQETISLLQGEYCAQPAHRRLRYPFQATPKAQRPVCGARCRDGHACKAVVVDGSRRCRMHGGLSTGPKTPAGRAAIAESNKRRSKGVGV